MDAMPRVAAAEVPVAAPGAIAAGARLGVLLHPALVLVICFGLALVTRLAWLDTAITTDEGFWLQRVVRFGTALNRGGFDGTFRTGHPGVTVLWVGLIGIGPERRAALASERYIQYPRLQRAPGYLDALLAARTSISVVSAILAAVIVLLSWKLLGAGPGLIGGLLVILEPYLVGSSRVLHVDALMPPLMTVSALAAVIYWTRDRRRQYLVLSAVAGGLALLTKTPAVFVALYFALLGLASVSPWQARRWRGLLPIAVWGGIAGTLYFALWPALWVNPIGRLADVAAFVRSSGGAPHPSSSFFLGQALQDDPGLLFYPVSLALRLGPVVSVGLLALLVGLASGLWRGRGREAVLATPTIWLLAYVVLFIGMMTLGAKKLDRYTLPAIMVLNILAGVGFWGIFARLRPVSLVPVGIGLLLVVQAAVLWRAYPYPIASYNPLLGGIGAARQAIVVGWGEGLDQVATYLSSKPDATRLDVVVNYQHVLRPLFGGTVIPDTAYVEEGPGMPRPPVEYFVIYINAAQRGRIPPLAQRAIEAGPPEFTAMVHGEEYAWLYPAPDFGERQTDAPTGRADDQEED